VKHFILKYWQEKPLLCILFLAGFFRLLAVLFSKGYGMHDDHFLVIEAAQSWVDGYDYNKWIPQITKGLEIPSGHSLLYPGFHYFLFRFLEFLGITDPQSKMYVVRFLHAVLSMSIVYLGYKMAEKISGSKAAKTTGLILALLFFMPMFSVRNLVEFVCIPPMMYATWLVMKNDDRKKNSYLLVAGIMLALALSIRFQTIVFIGGFYLVLLLQKKWKEIFLSAFGFILCIALIQGITDIIIWKRPFAEITEYVRYNMEHANEYIIQKWYNYIILLAGILIPPISIFIFFGYVRNWKKHLLLFLPSFIFLVFHSYLPSKQERFILPIIPFIITLGVCGWTDFVTQSGFWQRNQKLLRTCWIFFWAVNFIPLIFISTAYSHRSRVETMTYLSKKKDFKNFILEESQHDSYTMPPRFYLRHWVYQSAVLKDVSLESFRQWYDNTSPESRPNYVVFNEEENIEKRVQNFKKYFPGIELEAVVEPGLVDKVMHKLNKRNANFTSYIYRIQSTK
jgi:hypothetical protein